MRSSSEYPTLLFYSKHSQLKIIFDWYHVTWYIYCETNVVQRHCLLSFLKGQLTTDKIDFFIV